jgi:predicted nucleotidyltransferase
MEFQRFVLRQGFGLDRIESKNNFMITEKDKNAILLLARRYGVHKVLLFGSSTEGQKEARDIDLGVIGIEPRRFFEFYGDLMLSLSKPVDLIDLSKDTRFNALVKREGIPIYG